MKSTNAKKAKTSSKLEIKKANQTIDNNKHSQLEKTVIKSNEYEWDLLTIQKLKQLKNQKKSHFYSEIEYLLERDLQNPDITLVSIVKNSEVFGFVYNEHIKDAIYDQLNCFAYIRNVDCPAPI